jgi:hypothetical protein
MLFFLRVAMSRELSLRDKNPDLNTLDDAVSLIRDAKRMIILTGAGISMFDGSTTSNPASPHLYYRCLLRHSRLPVQRRLIRIAQGWKSWELWSRRPPTNVRSFGLIGWVFRLTYHRFDINYFRENPSGKLLFVPTLMCTHIDILLSVLVCFGALFLETCSLIYLSDSSFAK